MQIPTVKIKAKNKLGFMIVNEEDYNPDKDKLYAEPEPVEVKPEEDKSKKPKKTSGEEEIF